MDERLEDSRSTPARSRLRNVVAFASGVVAALMVGGAVVAAASNVFSPPSPLPAETQYTLATAHQGTVGASIELTTVATWASRPVGRNAASGTVTSVAIAAGQLVTAGDILYTVDLRPVVVAQGEIPSFESIAEKVKGEDVAQLQRLLVTLGFFNGSADGEAGPQTVRAIKAWQKQVGVEPTGVVEPGDVIFVPQLPARVSLDPSVIQRGAPVGGGESALNALTESPEFYVPIADSQSTMIPPAAEIQISSPSGAVWKGVAGEAETEPSSGGVKVRVTAKDGTSVCGSQCGELPATGETRMVSKIVTVADLSGVVIPTAALRTNAAGKVFIVASSGESKSVTVKATAKGMSVVEGIGAGEKVRLAVSESRK